VSSAQATEGGAIDFAITINNPKYYDNARHVVYFTGTSDRVGDSGADYGCCFQI